MRASEAICVLPTDGTFDPELGEALLNPREGLCQGLESEIAHRGVCVSKGWWKQDSRAAKAEPPRRICPEHWLFERKQWRRTKDEHPPVLAHPRWPPPVSAFRRDQNAAYTRGRRRRATRGHPRSRVARGPFKRWYNAGEHSYDHAGLSPSSSSPLPAKKAELFVARSTSSCCCCC